MSELEPGYNPENSEAEQKQEFNLPKILELLGFHESEEMQHTHHLLAEAIRANNEEDRKQLHNEYSDQLEALVESVDSAEVRIGAQIARASIYKEGGDVSRYVEDLEDIPEALNSIGLTELAWEIEDEIDSYK